MTLRNSPLRHVVIDQVSGSVIVGAAAEVLEADGVTPATGLFTTENGAVAAADPLVTNAQGEAEAWVRHPRPLVLRISDNDDTAVLAATGRRVSFDTYDERVDVQLPAVYSRHLFGFPMIRSMEVQTFPVNDLVGDHDVFTCPAGKRAYLLTCPVTNDTGGAITIDVWKIAPSEGDVAKSNANRIMRQSVPANSSAALTVNDFLGPGETLHVMTSGALDFLFGIATFDEDEFPDLTWNDIRISGVNAGAEVVVYTCPAGKLAVIPLLNIGGLSAAFASPNKVFNGEAVTRTIRWFLRRAGVSYQLFRTSPATLTTNTSGQTGFGHVLLPGDELRLTVDVNSPLMNVFCQMIELPELPA